MPAEDTMTERIEIIEKQTQQVTQHITNITNITVAPSGASPLAQLLQHYQELYYAPDTRPFELGLALMASRSCTVIPNLMLYLIGPSGCGKSSIIELFDDEGTHTLLLGNASYAAFVSGARRREGDTDLAQAINDRVVLWPETAMIATMPKEGRAQLQALLRQAGDGLIARTTALVEKKYTDIHTRFLSGGTHEIHELLLAGNFLGSREDIYLLPEPQDEELLRRVEQNTTIDMRRRRDELKREVRLFLQDTQYTLSIIPDDIKEELKLLAQATVKLRASASVDENSADLRDVIHPETPARAYAAYLAYYRGLKSLSTSYPDERALSIIRHLTLSACPDRRLKTLRYHAQRQTAGREWVSVKELADHLRVSRKTARMEQRILYHLDLLRSREEEFDPIRELSKEYFAVNSESAAMRALSKRLVLEATRIAPDALASEQCITL